MGWEQGRPPVIVCSARDIVNNNFVKRCMPDGGNVASLPPFEEIFGECEKRLALFALTKLYLHETNYWVGRL
jgi:hypothetical protein